MSLVGSTEEMAAGKCLCSIESLRLSLSPKDGSKPFISRPKQRSHFSSTVMVALSMFFYN